MNRPKLLSQSLLHLKVHLVSVLLLISVFALAQTDADDIWEIERLGTGFVFTEGPVWKNDSLYFSDLGDGKIYTWSEENGIGLFLDPSGRTNGMDTDGEGRLIMAQQEFRRMARMEADQSIEVLVTHFEGKRLNIPNDVAARSDGSIFFTDPPIGIREEDRELDFSGIFRISESGALYLLDKTVERPNGITFSRDESTLYVSDSRDKEVYAWDVSDTVITNKRQIASIDGNGYIDGMTTDDEGRLYVAGPIGVFIFQADGTTQDTILLGKQCSNCNWGGVSGTDLFITSGTELYKARRMTTGLGYESKAPQEDFKLGIHPNPFRFLTQISFHLNDATRIEVNIFDVSGKHISTPYNQYSDAGMHHFSLNASAMSPGLYYLVLESEKGIQTQKFVLQK